MNYYMTVNSNAFTIHTHINNFYNYNEICVLFWHYYLKIQSFFNAKRDLHIMKMFLIMSIPVNLTIKYIYSYGFNQGINLNLDYEYFAFF